MPLFGIKYTKWDNAHPSNGDKPLPYDEWDILESYEFHTFEDAKLFADQETQYSCGNEYQYMPFKMPPEMDYTTREDARIAAGEYELLPEHMRPCGTGIDYLYPRIVDKDNRKMIGYFTSKSNARFDKLTTVKPTKYFTMYFDESQGWDYMAELGFVSGEVSLTFVTTREDIRYAYENGPSSCMADLAERYHNKHVHPVEAYASPDLALAVLSRGENWKDNIVARALVNVQSKGYVRIYGDIKRMQKMLEEQGYVEDYYALGGCRLLKLYGRDNETGRELRRIIMTPYLDGGATRITLKDMRDEYMQIQPVERTISGNTSGYFDIA